MASTKNYLDFVSEQLSDLDEISYKAMNVDDKNFLTELLNAIYDELPVPKKKK